MSKEAAKARHALYVQRHPERRRETVKKSAARPEYREWLRQWSKSDDQRAKAAARKRKERSSPRGRLQNRMRVKLRRSLTSGARSGRSWVDILGYTVDDLRVHLERQFLPGMTWGNMGEWHIDHIVPLKAFSYASVDDPDFRAAWALSNLRPLWAKPNLIKNAKREFLL